MRGDIFKPTDATKDRVIEVLEVLEGDAELEGYRKLPERSHDAGEEKHVPVVTKQGDGTIHVVVGSVMHPMEEDHWIQFIELRTKTLSYKKFLNPGETPEATFPGVGDEPFVVREHCNKHGLWKTEAN